MATSSLNSLSGVTTGVDTTALINAIVAQKGTNVTRLKAQRSLNDQKTAALTAMSTSLTAFRISLLALQDKFNNRTVTSTDSNNSYVTATASGAASGNFDITVSTVATKGRISATLDPHTGTTNLAVLNPSDSVQSGIFKPGTTPASFAIQGTDGVIKTVTLTEGNNTLNGLRDAINGTAGLGVTAAVVNMGKGDKPYQLVITAKDTGTGTGATKGEVTIVDITNMAPDTHGVMQAGPSANSLGIAAGTVDSLTTPTALTGGLKSSDSGAKAVDATFTLNGIPLTRTTNIVKDAADGMTFTLKQGGQTGTTTLTVAPDKAGATTAMQDVLAKYNQLVKDYKTASTSTKNADGSINQAPLAGDASTRGLMANLQATLLGASAGLPSGSTYKALSSLGITTQGDGTLGLNTITFQNAMGNDLTSVMNLFRFSGTSNNQVVTVKSGGAATVTGAVDFSITKDDLTGILWGTLTDKNGTSSPIQVSNGTLVGTGDFAGLTLAVTGTGTGTLTLSRGAGQGVADLVSKFTAAGGGISSILNSITLQNKNLDNQIAVGQSRLDTETANLKKKFAQMEATVGQMRSAAGALMGA
jgi:flagellar hook-associated protein 2